MKPFFHLLSLTQSSRHFNTMKRLVQQLEDSLGINHFWYYRVTSAGFYTYLGSHQEWSEYCFEHLMIDQFPCLRHPDLLQEGVNLMKNSTSDNYKKVLSCVWEKFQINFNLNLIQKTADGVEAFGFGSKNNSPLMDQFLLNELPLLKCFISVFKEHNRKLIELVNENSINFLPYMGEKFYEQEAYPQFLKKREDLLRKLEIAPPFPFTPREKEILWYLSQGYPSSYIAKKLKLSFRTVENYTANIKSKLLCYSKGELIEKARHYLQSLYLGSYLGS